jgi:nitrite reductase/ring-hydroxylating ferredoxin subunit
MNSLGSVVLGASLVARLRGAGPARSLNYLGNGILTLSAYLGGHLVMEALVGTKHVSEAYAPTHFTAVMSDSDLKEQTLVRAEVEGYPVALYRRFGQIYAVADVCPHLGCSLSEGSVESDAIVCGCHGSRFALSDGAVLQGPSAYPTESYATRVVDGTIEIAPMSGVNR